MTLELVNMETGEINAREDHATFSDFWLLYPRRVAKKDAEKSWARVSPADRVKALVALVSWRRVWATKDTEFLPHPATWLNGERWEDELPSEYTQTSASHKPATFTEHERGTIPEHVKALLAKMRAK